MMVAVDAAGAEHFSVAVIVDGQKCWGPFGAPYMTQGESRWLFGSGG